MDLCAEGINPDVQLEAFHMNITSLEGFQAFRDSLCCGDSSKLRVDLVLSCVDNYEARMTINQASLSFATYFLAALHCAACFHVL